MPSHRDIPEAVWRAHLSAHERAELNAATTDLHRHQIIETAKARVLRRAADVPELPTAEFYRISASENPVDELNIPLNQQRTEQDDDDEQRLREWVGHRFDDLFYCRMTFVACCIAMVLLEFFFPDDREQLVYQSMFAGVMVSTVFWYFRLDLTRPDGALPGMEPTDGKLTTGTDRLGRHVMPTVRKYYVVESLALLAAISAVLKD